VPTIMVEQHGMTPDEPDETFCFQGLQGGALGSFRQVNSPAPFATVRRFSARLMSRLWSTAPITAKASYFDLK
jgi:hypothetical protein